MGNAPVICWQRGGYRIVAVDGDNAEQCPMLILERRTVDAMGVESWQFVPTHDEEHDMAMDGLMTEIVARVEVLPQWVRAFVREDLADMTDNEESNGGGTA